MNIINLAGYLGADPEVRFTSSGQKITVLRLAARVRRSKSDETVWWRATIWGEQFDKMIAYLKKGSSIMLIGDMNKPEIFTDKNGEARISMGLTVIQLMFNPFGIKSQNNDQSAKNQSNDNNQGFDQNDFSQGGFDRGNQQQQETSDEEIPF